MILNSSTTTRCAKEINFSGNNLERRKKETSERERE